MKKLVILAILALFSTKPAYADMQELCTILSQYAVTVAENRFAGVPINKTVEIAQTMKSAESRAAALEVIYAAYKLPPYPASPTRNSVIREFGNHTYLECIGE